MTRGLRALFAALVCAFGLSWASSGIAQYDDEPLEPPPTYDSDAYEYPHDAYGVSPAHGSAEIDRDLSELAPKLPFCSRPDFRVHKAEYHLCVYADDIEARCAGFKQACLKPPVGEIIKESGKGQGGKSGSDESKPETPTKIPTAMSGLARVVFWVLVFAGLGFLLFFIFRNFARDHADKAAAETVSPEPEADDHVPMRRGVVETDVDRLIARGRAAAAGGQFERGMDDVYAALLRYLEGYGHIDVNSSSTNGDYVRDLRENPELQRSLKESARIVERVQFGSESATRQGFEALIGRILPMLGRGLSLLLFVVGSVSLYSCDGLQRGSSSSLGPKDPGGHGLLADLLERRGIEVERRLASLDKLDDGTDVVVVHGPTFLEPDEWDTLLAWTLAGGRLIVANSRARPVGLLGAERGANCTGSPKATDSLYSSKRIIVRDSPALAPHGAHADEMVPLIACDAQPYALSRAHGSGSIVMLSEGQFLTNVSLLAADNASVALNVLIGQPTRVELVDRYTAAGETTPMQAVSNSNLLPFVLQLFLMAGALFLWRGTHFAKPRDPSSAGRRSFAEHVQALGAQYGKARASRLVLANYAGWALERLRERTQPGKRTGLISLASAISARTGRPEGEVMQILVECDSAKEDPAAVSEVPKDLRLMRELERLLAETGGRS